MPGRQQPSTSSRSAVPDAGEILSLIRRRKAKGMSTDQLVAHVTDRAGVDRSQARQLLRGLLRELERSGAVVMGRGKRYFASEHSDLVVGRVRVTRGGEAMLEAEAATEQTIMVPKRGLRGALHGDRVAVRLERPRRRARAEDMLEAVVVKVLERRHTSLVGRWVADDGRPHMRPLNRRLAFPVYPVGSKVAGEPAPGEFVVMSLEVTPDHGRHAQGTILERLGVLGEPGVEEAVVLRLHEIPVEFPAAAATQADALPDVVTGPEIQGRWDLRDRPVITIDGATARDFDDAVNARPGRRDEIEVEVHIADVSHYVREGTPIDESARERGTSVYFPGMAVPMLPEKLSNDLCSLREGVDRLAYTVRFSVAPDGGVTRYELHDSVIRSVRRCTYTEVFEWLELPRGRWPEIVEPFADSLALLAEAAQRLARRRHERGSLDFDLAEPEILLDPEGRMVAIQERARNRAHRLIEELMVAANECVGRLLMEADQPALYRVHDRPDPAKVQELAEVLAEFGYKLTGPPDELAPAQLQGALQAIADRPEERLLSTLILRTLARALYSPDPRGHYALATAHYLHFTSPIRRYPDLICHRMLRRLQSEGRTLQPPEREVVEADLERLGESCSSTEQRAVQAERDVVQWKKVLFMRDRVGEEFKAHIVGVTAFGMFVQLDEVFVEGLVHISELVNDFYVYDERRHVLTGERTGRRLRLGDPLDVCLQRVNLDAMQLDFTPLGIKPDPHSARRGAQRDKPPRRPSRRGSKEKGVKSKE